MKITELEHAMSLCESDEFIAEMANFLADVTELPGNLVLWTEPQPNMLPHDKYRMKVYKDRVHCATCSIECTPRLYWRINNKKLQLSSTEYQQVCNVISEYSTLFIQYVDVKLTAKEVKFEIKRLNGGK